MPEVIDTQHGPALCLEGRLYLFSAMTTETKAAMAAACAASIRDDLRKARERVEARERDWHARDVAAG